MQAPLECVGRRAALVSLPVPGGGFLCRSPAVVCLPVPGGSLFAGVRRLVALPVCGGLFRYGFVAVDFVAGMRG